jgi:hypothetical protein
VVIQCLEQQLVPVRDHIGDVPLLFETCTLPPVSGKARTFTWKVPDSSDV